MLKLNCPISVGKHPVGTYKLDTDAYHMGPVLDQWAANGHFYPNNNASALSLSFSLSVCLCLSSFVRDVGSRFDNGQICERRSANVSPQGVRQNMESWGLTAALKGTDVPTILSSMHRRRLLGGGAACKENDSCVVLVRLRPLFLLLQRAAQTCLRPGIATSTKTLSLVRCTRTLRRFHYKSHRMHGSCVEP